MNQIKVFSTVLLCVAVLFSCHKDTNPTPDSVPQSLTEIDALIQKDLIAAGHLDALENFMPTSQLLAETGMVESRDHVRFQRADVGSFQPAGPVGGGVLEVGKFFPPNRPGLAGLLRGDGWVSAYIATSGLPPGAYTTWWVTFDNPDSCTNPNPAGGKCSGADLGNPDVNASIFYMKGSDNVVTQQGNLYVRTILEEGEDMGEPGSQHFLGNGFYAAQDAEIHLIIKYHGPASDDPDVLYEQTHTLLGSCAEGANALDLGPVFGVHCPDFQAVVFKPLEY